MATDGKDDAVEGSWSPRRPRTAAVQRPDRPVVAQDPEVLAVDIERTREELAETLDAIADRVSPKRVAARTKKQVGETAARAEEAVKSGAAAAAVTAKDAAETVKDKVGELKERVGGGGGLSPAASSVRLTSSSTPDPVVHVSSASDPVLDAPNPLSQDTVTIPVDATTPAPGAPADATPHPVSTPAGSALPTYRRTTPVLPPAGLGAQAPVLAGAAAAVAVVLLVLRRRRRGRRGRLVRR